MNVLLKSYKGYIHEDDNGKFTFVEKEKATIYPLSKAHSKTTEIYNKIPFAGKIEYDHIR